MRSHLLTRLAAAGGIVVLSVLGGGATVLAEQGRSAEHRNDQAAHEAHGSDEETPLTEPQPQSNADFSGSGANEHGPYDSTRDGSPSDNGVGDGAATGEPCAGCVGQADNKNPPGQLPDATDPNQGYECDGNQGIARSNPAHTGCAAPPIVTEIKKDITKDVNTDVAAIATDQTPAATVLGVSFTAPPVAVLAGPDVALAATGPAQDLGGLAMAGAVLVLMGAALHLTMRRSSGFSGTA